MVTRRAFLRNMLIGSAPVLCGSALSCRPMRSEPTAKRRPNIVIILADDRTETDDLAARCPERVESMGRQWERWAAEVGLKKK